MKLFRSLSWFIAAALILGIAFVWEASFLAYATYALLLVLAFSLFITFMSLKGIEVKREVDRTEVNIGEEVRVNVEIRNRSWYPVPWVYFEETVPEKNPVHGQVRGIRSLLPRGGEHFLYQVRFNRRGYYPLGPLVMETGDIFGLYKRFKIGKTRDYITVYPNVIYLTDMEFATRRPLGNVRFTHRIFEDPSRIVGVREYVQGDRLSRLHWKATARTGRLHSKLYDPTVIMGATIVLDFHEQGFEGDEGDEREELAVTAAASLAYFVFQRREQVGFFTNGRDAAEVAKWVDEKGQGALTRKSAQEAAREHEKSTRLRAFQVETKRSEIQALQILDACARVMKTDGLTLDKLLLHESGRLPRDAALLVVTPLMTDMLSATIANLQASGFVVVVYIIKNEKSFLESSSYLGVLKIPVYHLQHPQSFDEIVAGKKLYR